MIFNFREHDDVSSDNIAILPYLKGAQLLALRIEEVHFSREVCVSTKESSRSRDHGVGRWLEGAFNFENFNAVQILLIHQTVIVFVPLAEEFLRSQAAEEHFARSRFTKLIG